MASSFLNQLSQADPSTVSSYLPNSLAGLVPYLLTALTLYLSLTSFLSTGRFFVSLFRFALKWASIAALGLSAWATWNGNGDQVGRTALSTANTAFNVAKWGFNALDPVGRVQDLFDAGQGRAATGSRASARRNARAANARAGANAGAGSGWNLDDLVGGDKADVLKKVSDSVLSFVGREAEDVAAGAKTKPSKLRKEAQANKAQAKAKADASSGAGFRFDPVGWAGRMAFGEQFGEAKKAWEAFTGAMQEVKPVNPGFGKKGTQGRTDWK